MATTIKLDRDTGRKIALLLGKPLKNMGGFFGQLSLLFMRFTDDAFMLQGARGGHPAWRGFEPETLRTPAGTWNIRYGTDLKGRKKGTYAPFKMRPGNIRRYGPDSLLLQASGGFRKSFKTLRRGKNSLLFGTRHELAEKIMGKKNREVIFLTPKDLQNMAEQFKMWYSRGLLI